MLACCVAGLCAARTLGFELLPPTPGEEAWTFKRELAEAEDLSLYSTNDFVRTGEMWISNRITRCFFGPIKRPPNNRDELADDVDYYPDAYLARLKREGMNGVWITVEFRDLAETRFTKRRPDAPRKLAKLRRTVEKCAKYGIKVWLFAIEPHRLILPDELYAEHRDELCAWEYPENIGSHGKVALMCPSLPGTRAYLEDSTRDIFTQVPGLGGLINISHGERTTSCLSLWPRVPGEEKNTEVFPYFCPHCSKKEPWQIHYLITDAMAKGMRSANPSARLISWIYHSPTQPFRSAWVYEVPKHPLPDGVTLQYNFEAGTVKLQEGRWRAAGDYWLAEPGPSAIFARLAESARAAGNPMSAKIQTGNSHEIATLPFVPAPGLLYRKYREMRKLGVADVMQCWYFGCYPGVMNEAAGLLSSEDFSKGDETAFLLRLATPKWGADAVRVAALWKGYSDAYADYPFSNVMQYYGPFHAGIVWPLFADIGMKSLLPTWLPYAQRTSGDTIAECLKRHHSLSEAVLLARRMYERAAALAGETEALGRKYAASRTHRLDLGLMKALTLQFESAFDIFSFYAERREAVTAGRRGEQAKARASVARMAGIVRREKDVSAAMLPLCRDDSRLGYHSEAESHLYHPALLEWRIRSLDETLMRLGEIDAALARGEGYPESDFERNAPTAECTFAANGDLVLEGVAGGEGRELYAYFYDATGTLWPVRHVTEPDADGRYRFVIPAADWDYDERLKPAWVRLQRDLHNTWRFPDTPPSPWRLRLDAPLGDRFARLKVK